MGKSGVVVMTLLFCLYCRAAQSQVPVVEFSSSKYTVSEGMGTVALCVTLSNGVGGDITVTLSAEPGSGADYVLADTTIGFGASSGEEVEECVAVTIIDDASVEGDHNFTVSIAAVSGQASIGSIDTATVLITDNDVATVSLVSPAQSVVEDNTAVEVCAVLTSPSGGTEIDIVIELGSNGSSKAVEGMDFMDFSVNTPTVAFSAGTAVGEQSCVDINIKEDESFEGNHSFTVSLSSVVFPSASMVTFVSPAETVITIVDDDVIHLQLTALFERVNEGGVVPVCLVATSLPRDGLECDVDVTWETVDGTATTDDYTAAHFELSIPQPAFRNPICFDVRTLGDSSNAIECDRYFTVAEVSSGPGIVILTPTAINITIADDSAPTLSFTSDTTMTVAESVGSITLCAQITFTGTLECNFEAPLTIQTDDITTADEDFISTNSIVFESGLPSGSEACTDIIIVDDEALEGSHSFTVSLIGSEDTHVEIMDNEDSATIGLLEGVTASEGEVVLVCAVLTDVPADGTERSLAVTFAVENGNKTVEGEDFTVISPLMSVFPPTQVNGTQQCINISIASDGILEGPHSFLVKLTEVSPDIVTLDMGHSSAIIDIADGDSVSVQLLEPSAAKEGGNLTVCAALTFLGPTANLDCSVTVYLNTTNGKAELGIDFDHPTIFSITFDTDCNSGTVECVSIFTTDDDELEGDQDFSISLISSTLEGNVVLSSQSVTAIISENDVFCPAETFSTASGTYSWPITLAAGNTLILYPCEFGPAGQTVSRECDSQGIWMNMDASLCYNEFDLLANVTVTSANIIQSLTYLLDVIERTHPSEETEQNVAIISDVLNQIANLVADPSVMLEPMTVNQIVQILGFIQEWDATVLEKGGPSIVQSLEFNINNFTQQENFTDFTVIQPNIALVAEKLDMLLAKKNGHRFSVSSNNGELSVDSNTIDEFSLEDLATIGLPASLFSDSFMHNESVSMVFIIYETAVLFPLSDVPNTTVVGSSVLGATVVTDEPLVVNEEVEIILRINQEGNVTNHSCVFWDFGAAGGQGNWSSEGCRTERDAENGDTVRCLCDHLTNFAVLVDICSRTGCDPLPSGLALALDIISIIGVSLSLAGIVLTVITLLVFKKLRERDTSKFHVQLCAALFAMLLVFVIGIDRTEVYGGCVAVSALIQYFTQVAVMMMAAEAILMFQKLVIVFTQITTKYVVGVSIVCWALPIVSVLVPLIIDRDFMVTYQDTVEPVLSFCFIGNTAVFFGAFLAPMFVIILFNCVVFMIVISVLIKHQCFSKMQHDMKLDPPKFLQLLIGIIGVMFLFGLTWLFGALTVTGARLVFQVLFAVFNTLQGFFIFLFYCIMNEDARELWKEKLTCGRYKSVSRKSGGVGATLKNNPNTMSTGTATGRSHYNYHSSDTEGQCLSTFKQVHAADREAALDSSQVINNPANSSILEQDSELSRNDEVSDSITSENIGDFQYGLEMRI